MSSKRKKYSLKEETVLLANFANALREMLGFKRLYHDGVSNSGPEPNSGIQVHHSAGTGRTPLRGSSY